MRPNKNLYFFVSALLQGTSSKTITFLLHAGIGKHVTVRSPGGLTQDEALRMVQSAQYYPRLVASLECGLRFLPAYRKLRSALCSGLVGPAATLVDVRISMGPLVGCNYDWLCDAAMGGGVLNLLGGHIVDLVHFLTGRRALRATRTG